MGRIPRICFALLFPFHALYAKQSECHYDRLTDIYTIRGMKFSGTIFNYFNNECNKGKIVKMVQHDGEVCTIQYLTDKELEQAVHLNNELERVLNEASK